MMMDDDDYDAADEHGGEGEGDDDDGDDDGTDDEDADDDHNDDGGCEGEYDDGDDGDGGDDNADDLNNNGRCTDGSVAVNDRPGRTAIPHLHDMCLTFLTDRMRQSSHLVNATNTEYGDTFKQLETYRT
jgi:hypothetical protein